MDQTARFSVIITSFGVGRRVERAVDSVRRQTLDDVELMVIDDASTDDETLAALDRLPAEISIERLAERQGVGRARNLGLAATNAPYVLCLDGDDWIEPGYLEAAREIFEASPETAIVSAWVRYEGDRSGEWRPEPFGLDELMAANRISSASIFRRDASSPHHYAESMNGYEDWDHWISILAAGWSCRVIPEFLIHYEWRSGSLGKASNQRAFALVEAIVERHPELYRERIASVLAHKHRQVLALESETHRAWQLGADAERELQRVWGLVGELGDKLETQSRSVDELTRELRRVEEVLRGSGPE